MSMKYESEKRVKSTAGQYSLSIFLSLLFDLLVHERNRYVHVADVLDGSNDKVLGLLCLCVCLFVLHWGLHFNVTAKFIELE